MRSGYRLQIGWTRGRDDDGEAVRPLVRLPRGVLLCILAIIALVMFWPRGWLPHAAGETTVAHIQPATATAPAPAPVSTIRLTGSTGAAICVVPTGKTPRTVELVKTP